MSANCGTRWLITAAVLAAAVVGVGRALERPALAVDRARVESRVLDETIAALEGKYAGDPHNTLIASKLADSYMLRFGATAQLADVERAEELARSTLRLAADSAVSFARLSAILLAQHRFAEAFEAAGSAVAADSTDAAALSALFDAALGIGAYRSAAEALSGLAPGTMDRQLREVRWMSAHGHLNEAYRRQRLSCDRMRGRAVPRQIVAWCLTLLADIAHQASGADQARAWLDGALEIRPGYRGAIEKLADLAYADGRWQEADRLYGTILADAHPDLYLRLAEVSRAIGDTADARRYEGRFLTIATVPGSEALHARPLALHYAQRGESLDRALELARADTARRKTVEAYDALAWVHFRRGALREALQASDQARRWAEPSPTADYQRARILEALGRRAEARTLYESALADLGLLEHHVQVDARRAGKIR